MLISGSDETLKSFTQLSRSSIAWRYQRSALKELTASSATARKIIAVEGVQHRVSSLIICHEDIESKPLRSLTRVHSQVLWSLMSGAAKGILLHLFLRDIHHRLQDCYNVVSKKMIVCSLVDEAGKARMNSR